MDTKIIFGQRIKELRNEKQLKQSELAAALGVHTTQICEMETGKKTTTIERLVILANYFNVSADYLLGLTDKK